MRTGSSSARWSLGLALFVGCSGSSCSGPSGGAGADRGLGAADADEGRLDDGWILAVESAGLERVLPDARDAGLLRALDLVDERVLELVAQGAPPPGSVELLCELLAAPWRGQVGILEDAPTGGIPLKVEWTFRGRDAQQAEDWSRRLGGLIGLFALPRAECDDDSGLTEVALPQGLFFYGTPPDDSTLVVRWGPAPTGVRGALGQRLPRGVQPAFGLELELGRLLRFLATQGDESHGPLMREWMEKGQELGLSLAVGHDAQRTRMSLRYRGWAPMMEAFEMLERTPITREQLDVIPADATVASLSRFEPSFLTYLAELLDDQSDEEVLAELEQALGLPLADLIEPLEGTFGYFLSDTTGGSGLASMVFFASLRDEPRMASSLEHLTARANAMGVEEGEGYVRLRTYTDGNATCIGLTFPGFPVPLEPSLAMAAGQLVIAATPQALAGAIDHLESGRPGLSAHPALRGLGRGALDNLQGLQFLDAPRLLRDGYGLLGLLTSALANGVRSATDLGRDPGLVLPAYHDLLEGAQPGLVLMRIDGQDLVLTGQGDRSLLVQLGATLNFVVPFLVPSALGAFAGTRAMLLQPAEYGTPFEYSLF